MVEAIRQLEEESRGEFPVHLGKLGKFFTDASIVLEIRRRARQYQVEHGLVGPVADLMAEEAVVKEDPWMRVLNGKVVHPLSFVLPTPVLRCLSWFR